MDNLRPKYTLKEALKNLSSEQKNYYDELVKYADSKPRAEIKEKVHYIKIGVGNNPYIILYIKHNTVIANFRIESEDYLKSRYFDKSKKSPAEFDIKISNDEALKEAKNNIDKRVEQMANARDIKRLANNAKNRNARKNKE